MGNTREQIPVKVVDKILGGDCKVRIALAAHPVTGEIASCVPYLDYARAFTYDESSIFKMVQRTEWLKKHSSTAIMEVEGVGYRPHLCLFEEAMLGVFMKLQPQRCKDPEVARKVNERQEEMILILRDVLKGYRTRGFVDEENGLLPRPGLSASAIPSLCRQANRGCRFSARALSHFYAMPVEDLLDDVFSANPDTSEIAPLIARYLSLMFDGTGDIPGVKKEGDSFVGRSRDFAEACEKIGRSRDLPRFFSNVMSFCKILSFERDALESIGWRREYARKLHGENYYRFSRIKNAIGDSP